MAEITLKGASMTYPNGTKALTSVDLTVRDHEFLVLLGPSGCGKSTLLRLVAGLEKPTEGEVLFDGKVVNDLEPLKRNVAMVFQSFALYPHLNVYKNMAFPLKSMKLKPEEIQRRVEEAAKILDIEHVLNRRPRVLSGGQRQRVALGRAMVREPVVFLLDEPLSNLDVKMRLELRDQIVSLHKRLGTTFLYVTHDQAEAMQLGDRLAVMDTGRIVQIGSPQEIYDHPNSLYVADFIGAPKMNFFAALLRADGPNWSVRLLGREMPLPPERIDQDAALAPGMRVVVGVRPEDFALSRREDAYAAAVGQVMPMGATQHVEAYVGNQRFLVSLNSHTPVCEGDTLRLEVDPHTVHLFAAEGGQNLLLPPRKGGKA
ncbi:MAG TPA: ATP-binding cassette domain-containing protein [Candidatus Pullichristensenella avicola]|nr:ATP-binding cassette domain-containing protein [Candidatus Pullichristensenella avicola]